MQQILGELLPVATLEEQYQKRFDESELVQELETTRVTGRLGVPFYQGGGVSGRVRRAKETNNQLKKQVKMRGSACMPM